MSEVPATEAQWVKFVEQACSQGQREVAVPQASMSLDDAIHLALRLDGMLRLVGDNYVFCCPDGEE
jgi:hypothetical protein